MDIRPIGMVHSSVSDPEQMPFEGVRARIELFPSFEEGLVGIGGGTHIMVMGWLHHASRDVLQVARTRSGEDGMRGVFGLRASHRPNPIGLTPCRLEKVEGLNLYVERLDLVDGTPVVDIKRYSPSWDCIFSARSSRDLRFPEKTDRRVVFDSMMVEATNFHGERCVGVALGVRLLYHAMMEWQMPQKDPKLVLHMGEDGCTIDALQGLTGATLGNGRMKVPMGRAFRLSYDDSKIIAFMPRGLPPDFGVEDVLNAHIEDLFTVRADEYVDGEGPHGGRPAKRVPAEDRQAMLIERVMESLVDGKLPCAVAYGLARDLGVAISDIGWAADASRVRIARCQLGCFK